MEKDFAELLKKIRKSTALTQEQLAQRLGVTCVSVNGWENARRKPSPLARKQIEQFVRDAKIRF